MSNDRGVTELLVVALPETAAFWQHAERDQLAAPYCLRCAAFFFYPRAACPRCWSTDLEWRVLSGRGKVASYTLVERTPPGSPIEAPFFVVLVDLDEGIRMMGNLIGVPAVPHGAVLDLPVMAAFDHARAFPRLVFRPRG
jgi:uncharacterized OB-fold protein